MKRIFYLFVAFSIVIAACTKKEEKKTEVKNEAVKVKIETASMQEIDQIYEFTSTVDAAVKNYISSAGGTRIEKIGIIKWGNAKIWKNENWKFGKRFKTKIKRSW